MKYKRILVTGTARSGTNYTAELLSQLAGIPVSHEEIFGLHKVTPKWVRVTKKLDPFGDPPDWGKYRIAVSWMAMPFLDRLPDDVMVIHQVRNPLHTIRSIYRRKFLNRKNAYGRFAVDTLDRTVDANDDRIWGLWTLSDGLLNACEYWCRWSESILHSRRQLWWRVEDLHASHWILEPLLEHVVGDVRNPVTHLDRITVPTDINGGKYDDSDKPLSIEDIPDGWRGRVENLARKFGYEL